MSIIPAGFLLCKLFVRTWMITCFRLDFSNDSTLWMFHHQGKHFTRTFLLVYFHNRRCGKPFSNESPIRTVLLLTSSYSYIFSLLCIFDFFISHGIVISWHLKLRVDFLLNRDVIFIFVFFDVLFVTCFLLQVQS